MTMLVVPVSVTPVDFAVTVTIDPVTILVPVGSMIAAHATRHAENGDNCAQCAYPAECVHFPLSSHAM
jgi:hypothetical protein